jgi:hypothetical protein
MAFSALDRSFSVAVPLRAGGFLLVGGGVNAGSPLQTPSAALTQRFDPSAGTFTRSGDLVRTRSGDVSATLLADGRVLVAGGGAEPSTFTEIYDPATRGWQPAADLLVARRGHTATLLRDGRVLVAGGVVCCTGDGRLFTDAAEIYDPVSGQVQATGTLRRARGYHRATLLADGRVLLSGGYGATTATPGFETLTSCELFDPRTGTFSQTGALHVARALHSTIVLPGDDVLAAAGMGDGSQSGAGIPELELFDGTAWSIAARLDPALANATATLLGNGKVLLYGGEDAHGFPRADTWLLE